MKQFLNTNGDVVIVERGEELLTQLTEHAKERKLKSAWLSGLGGSGSATLGFYNLQTKKYEWKKFDWPLEILSLTGNMSWVDGEPFWHVHGTFSSRDFHAFGGHVKDLVVSLTCEVLVTPLKTPLTRVYDDETGLKLLDLQGK